MFKLMVHVVLDFMCSLMLHLIAKMVDLKVNGLVHEAVMVGELVNWMMVKYQSD